VGYVHAPIGHVPRVGSESPFFLNATRKKKRQTTMMMHATPPPAKKQKTTTGKSETFRMVISAPCSFKNMCDILGSVFETLTFTVNASESFTGMKVNALDSKQVAFVQLKYACQVTIANDLQEMKTCVKLKHLNELLKYVPNLSVLHMVQYESDNNLTLETFDERRSKKVFYIKTLQLLEDDDVSMADIQTGNLIEFDLGELKGFVKHSQVSKATEIDFSILQHKREDRKDRLIVTKFFGDGAGRCGYHHQPEKDSSTTKMLGETNLDMDEWKPFYKGTFDSAMIHSFLKNMDRESKIVVCLSDDVMILDYNLGIEASHIRFYLAVKDVDDSE
jgi:hypothetical protein